MKRALYIIGIALAAIGCAKDNTSDTLPSSDEISLSAGVVTRVGTGVNDCSWAENDQIGVFTTNGEENLLFSVDSNGTMTNQSETSLMILASGVRTYYAYHPYAEDQSSTSMSIDRTVNPGSNPLLWATKVSNDSNVELEFSHKYAKVVFDLTAGGEEVTSLNGAEVWLTGANTKATFSIVSGEFESPSSSDLTLTDLIDDGSISIYLPPMESLSGNVKLWVTAESKTFVYTIANETWASGNIYTHVITVGEK